MYKALLAGIIFLFFSLICSAQNLTGTWEGTMSGTAQWRISIVQVGDSCYGSSYDADPGFCLVNFVASYEPEWKRFKGQGLSFIDRTPEHALTVCNLRYIKDGDDEYLHGTVWYKSAAMRLMSMGVGFPGLLKKVSNKVDSTEFLVTTMKRLARQTAEEAQREKEVPKVEEAIVAPKIDNDSIVRKNIIEDSISNIKNSRTTVVAKTITVKTDTVKVILYDDGEIDGDIITVFDNGKIVINKLLLTAKPYEMVLNLPANNSLHTIELMAENEGSIPPNTAYMLIIAGEQRVELKASSNTKSNAAVIIQRSK